MDTVKLEKNFKLSFTSLRALEFLYSKKAESFIYTLSENRFNAIMLLKKNHPNLITQEDNISDIIRSTEPIEQVVILRERIRQVIIETSRYMEFLEKYNPVLIDLDGLYTYKTAPYFFHIFDSGYESKPFNISKLAEEIHEYLLYLLENQLANELEDPEFRSVFFLYFKEKLDVSNIAYKLSISSRKVKEIIKKAADLFENICLEKEDHSIDFLKLTKLQRKILILTFKGKSIEEISARLNVSAASIHTTKYKIQNTHNNIYNNGTLSFDASQINISNIPETYARFTPRYGLLIQNYSIQALATTSKYSKQLHYLLSLNRKDLVQLYFLLCEIPSIKLIAQIIGSSEVRITTKVREMKRLFEIESRDLINWVEISNLGKMFLLLEIDFEILNIMQALSQAGEIVSTTKILESLKSDHYNCTYIRHRLKIYRRYFKIPEDIPYSEFHQYISEGMKFLNDRGREH